MNNNNNTNKYFYSIFLKCTFLLKIIQIFELSSSLLKIYFVTNTLLNDKLNFKNMQFLLVGFGPHCI